MHSGGSHPEDWSQLFCFDESANSLFPRSLALVLLAEHFPPDMWLPIPRGIYAYLPGPALDLPNLPLEYPPLAGTDQLLAGTDQLCNLSFMSKERSLA